MQYLDFSTPGLPWEPLLGRLQDIVSVPEAIDTTMDSSDLPPFGSPEDDDNDPNRPSGGGGGSTGSPPLSPNIDQANNSLGARQDEDAKMAAQILHYLNSKGFTRVSFKRLKKKYGYSEQGLSDMVSRNRNKFRLTWLRDRKSGRTMQGIARL